MGRKVDRKVDFMITIWSISAARGPKWVVKLIFMSTNWSISAAVDVKSTVKLIFKRKVWRISQMTSRILTNLYNLSQWSNPAPRRPSESKCARPSFYILPPWRFQNGQERHKKPSGILWEFLRLYARQLAQCALGLFKNKMWRVAFVWLALCFSLGLSRFQLFFYSRPFLLDLMYRWYQFVAGSCERFGLNFSMRDILYLCGSCCACSWGCRGSNLFSSRVRFFDLMFCWDQFVAGCCECFGLQSAMRDMLHLCGLNYACPWACDGSNLFSLRVRFCWISCLADVNLLQVVVSDLVCAWVCVICCICVACVALVLGLDAAPTCLFSHPFFWISCLAGIHLLVVVVSGLVCI